MKQDMRYGYGHGQGGGGGGMMDKKNRIKNYAINKVIAPDWKDEQFWQLIKEVPTNSEPLAYFGLLLNIVMPGFGTMMAACAVKNG